MKHGPVGPEERKGILKKIYHALRQSPMFTHYSVEHIRDSAIKSEQLTFDRSQTKQEYMTAMHTKLAKIEKSYVMNTEEILREMGNKSGHISTEQHTVNNGSMRMYREPMNKMHGLETMDEYSMHGPKSTGQEFISLTSHPQGRDINFSFIQDEARVGMMRHGMGNGQSAAGGMGLSKNGMGNMQMGGLSMKIPGGHAYSSNHHAQQEIYPTKNNGHIGIGPRVSAGLGRGIIAHTEGMGNGFINLHGSSPNSTKKSVKQGMFKGGMGGYSAGQNSISGRGAHSTNGIIPNIIKLEPINEHNGNRNEIVTPIDIKEVAVPRDMMGSGSTDGIIRQGMGRLEPFAALNSGNIGDIGNFSILSDPIGEIQGIGMGMGGMALAPSIHRSGAAGSTNTVTKMNNSNRMSLAIDRSSLKTGVTSNSGVREVKPEDKPKARSRDRPETLEIYETQESPKQRVSPEKKKEDERKEEIRGIFKEVENMKDVVETHRNIFPRWEKKRKVFDDLEVMLHQKAEEAPENMEGVQGIYQQLKKHIITLSTEIKEGKSLTFKKRLGRISSAFMQKQKTQPEYQFMSTEELLLEYN